MTNESFEEPFMDIVTSLGDIRCDRSNTKLYTFYGAAAIHNHVFIIIGVDELTGRPRGPYIFPQHGEVFKELVELVMENGFPMDLNANEVQKCDQDALVHVLTKNEDIDSIFEGWENEINGGKTTTD